MSRSVRARVEDCPSCVPRRSSKWSPPLKTASKDLRASLGREHAVGRRRHPLVEAEPVSSRSAVGLVYVADHASEAKLPLDVGDEDEEGASKRSSQQRIVIDPTLLISSTV